jgi:hypothetical protein
MTTLMKYAVAAALTGAMALAAASPSEARSGRIAAAPIGFGDYAYEPAPVYVGRAPSYYSRGYRSNLNGCLSSPASPSFGVPC